MNNMNKATIGYARELRKIHSIERVARVLFGQENVVRDHLSIAINTGRVWNQVDSWSDLDLLVESERELALDRDEQALGWNSVETSVW